MGTSNSIIFLRQLHDAFPDHSIDYFQSNVEGLLIDKIQGAGFTHDAIILNAGAYTHTSIGISDAISAIPAPVIEVHISNIYKRESYRHKSIISAHCVGMIAGLGLEGYKLACRYFTET